MRPQIRQICRSEPLRFVFVQAASSFSDRYYWENQNPCTGVWIPRKPKLKPDPRDMCCGSCYILWATREECFNRWSILPYNSMWFWYKYQEPFLQPTYFWRYRNKCFLCTLVFQIQGKCLIPRNPRNPNNIY